MVFPHSGGGRCFEEYRNGREIMRSAHGVYCNRARTSIFRRIVPSRVERSKSRRLLPRRPSASIPTKATLLRKRSASRDRAARNMHISPCSERSVSPEFSSGSAREKSSYLCKVRERNDFARRQPGDTSAAVVSPLCPLVAG